MIQQSITKFAQPLAVIEELKVRLKERESEIAKLRAANDELQNEVVKRNRLSRKRKSACRPEAKFEMPEDLPAFFKDPSAFECVEACSEAQAGASSDLVKPDYEAMNEDELKVEMKKYGMKRGARVHSSSLIQ